jgi:hypothetical protein
MMNQDYQELSFIADTVNNLFFDYDLRCQSFQDGVRSMTLDKFRLAFRAGRQVLEGEVSRGRAGPLARSLESPHQQGRCWYLCRSWT